MLEIELSQAQLEKLKQIAAYKNVSLDAVIEEAIKREISIYNNYQRLNQVMEELKNDSHLV